MSTTKGDHVITVGIADDHALFRAGVKTSLAKMKDVELVLEADNGMQLLKLLEKIEPDVILLDIQMPIMDGIQTLPEIRKRYPNVKVLILSMHNDPSMISKLMESGANSYLTKNSDSEIIYQAIKTCYEQEYFFNELTNKALLKGLRTKRSDIDVTQGVELTEKELTVLKLVCEEKTTREIADIVDISPRTVEAIRDKLKTKTGAKTMAGLVAYAVKNNLLDQTEEKVKEEKATYNLSSDQMTKLFGLSTSILSYINHDLSGQRSSIYYALTLIKEEIGKEQNKLSNANTSKINDLIAAALDATQAISTITDTIRSHFYWNTQDNATDFNALFVSYPTEIIETIRKRYKKATIDVEATSINSLEIIYPPKVLLAILSELTENARKVTKTDLKILVKWWMQGTIFCCEVHDNGPGFQSDKMEKYIPLEFLSLSEDEKKNRMGLKIINRTILDSGGHLFFSHSKLLKGALVYFEFPVFDFNH